MKIFIPLALSLLVVLLSQDLLLAQPATVSKAPAAGATTAPSAAVDPRKKWYTDTQIKAADSLSEFFHDRGQLSPGDPQNRTLAARLGDFMRERAGGTAPAIKFAEFPDNEDYKGTNAEYDAGKGNLQIRQSIVDAINAASSPPKIGETGMDYRILKYEYAQTIVHEFIHTSQGSNPGTTANEALAYRGALNAAHAWLEQFEAAYAANPTKENARNVWAMTSVWQGYLGTIEIKIGQGKCDASALDDKPALDAESKRLTELRERMINEHRAIEVLEGLAGPPLIPGPRTLTELLTHVEAASLAELEQKLLAAARKQAELGAGGNLKGNPANFTDARKLESARDLTKQVLPLVKKYWEARLAPAVAAVKELQRFKLVISTPSSDLLIDPQTSAAEVELKVENVREYEKLAGTLKRALTTACGSGGKTTLTESWKVTDKSSASDAWTGNAIHSEQLKKPKKYKVSLVYNIALPTGLVAQGIPNFLTTTSNELEVEVKSAVPTANDLAGTWTGNLVIKDSPYLDALAADPPPADLKDPDPCQFLAIRLGPAVKALKGQPMKIKVTMKPQSETAGMIFVVVTAPRELGGKEGVPQKFPYSYKEGKLTVNTLAQKELRMRMSASFSLSPQGQWSFRGNWEGMADVEGKTIRAMAGEWSAEKQ